MATPLKSKSKKAKNGVSEIRREEVQQALRAPAIRCALRAYLLVITSSSCPGSFFLKALEESENRREEEAAFNDTPYQRRLDGKYRWSKWALRTDRPDQMLIFVNTKLFPRLRKLGDDPLAVRLGRIFSTIKNHQSRGSSFARVVAQVNRLHFNDRTDVIVLSEIYERLLKDVAQVAGYAGEFYTPRHIVNAMVQVVSPRMGDRVYDPCFGSAGFLFIAAQAIRDSQPTMSGEELERFHKQTFYGREMGRSRICSAR